MNTDSSDYQILMNAVKQVQSIDGLTCEIGVREGGGTKCILDAMVSTNQHKVHIAIDPFGNIPYKSWEVNVNRLDYTNQMKNGMLKNLYAYCEKYHVECLFFPLEDTEFFKRYSEGVPIYDQEKKIVNQYALVFIDGPHTSQVVKDEFDFFKDKIPVGGYIVFDDMPQYDHMTTLDPYIRQHQFRIYEKTEQKISYVKE